MKLLALDTSSHMSSVCFYDADSEHVLAEDCRDIGRGHAEVIMEQIANCLDRSGSGYSDLARIVVANGPGSFTGIRVGMAVARGLKLSLGIPAIGVSSLDACRKAAENLGHDAPVFCLLDARRGQLHGLHPDWDEPRIMTIDEAVREADQHRFDLCGSGATMTAERTKKTMKVVHEFAAMPILGYCELGAQANASEHAPEPVYLRSADAKPQDGFALPRFAG